MFDLMVEEEEEEVNAICRAVYVVYVTVNIRT